MAAVRAAGVSGRGAQGDEGIRDLEDVGPAPQEIRERGPEPPHDVLADVERDGGQLGTGTGRVGAGRADEGEQVGVDARSHGDGKYNAASHADPPGPPMVELKDIQAAAKVIEGHVVNTPCLHSRTLSDITGAQVWLKFENLQFTASFKERGALNKLTSLAPAEARRA
jgi:hypothetical protein